MKSYPSIPKGFQVFKAYVFDKIDGSNLRFGWSKKRGFYKFGTRNRLFDMTDPVFAPAIPIFMDRFAEPLTILAKEQRWESMVVFGEFYGPHSFAGLHDPKDQKSIKIFDIAPYKLGLLGPKEYLELTDPLCIPRADFLGIYNWTEGFCKTVRDGTFPVATSGEGVVGKAGSGNTLIMAKAKHQTWVDRVLALYGAEEGKKLVES